MAKVRVGLVGCGFVSELHMYAYKRVYGVDAAVTAVAARGDHVVAFAKKHGIPTTYRSFEDLLADRAIDVIDICTPPMLHAAMIVAAVQAGKHVICEKPFAGYFGRDGDRTPIGRHVAKSLMYARLIEEMDKTRAAIAASALRSQALPPTSAMSLPVSSRTSGSSSRPSPSMSRTGECSRLRSRTAPRARCSPAT